jgi:hypothetical protein
MSDRKKTHHGRDTSGHFKVKRADVDDLKTEPGGEDLVRDDVRLGGAIEDTGPGAGPRGDRIGDLAERNREDVGQSTKRPSGTSPRPRPR